MEQELLGIKERNDRVEVDKAWETSTFRTVTLTIVTYVLVTLLLLAIGNNDPFVNALVPALGYFLSAQSLPFIKKWWIRKNFKNKK